MNFFRYLLCMSLFITLWVWCQIFWCIETKQTVHASCYYSHQFWVEYLSGYKKLIQVLDEHWHLKRNGVKLKSWKMLFIHFLKNFLPKTKCYFVIFNLKIFIFRALCEYLPSVTFQSCLYIFKSVNCFLHWETKATEYKLFKLSIKRSCHKVTKGFP